MDARKLGVKDPEGNLLTLRCAPEKPGVATISIHQADEARERQVFNGDPALMEEIGRNLIALAEYVRSGE